TDLQGAIGAEFAAAKAQWEGKEIARLIDAPPTTRPETKIALKLLTTVAPSAYLIDPQLWMVIVLKGVNLSLEYGSIPESCISFTNYGVLLNSVLGDYKSGYEFGLLALNLIEKWGSFELKSKACAAFANSLSFWFKHIKESNILNKEGYQAALESGDLEYAGYILLNTSLNSFFQGQNLSQISKETTACIQFANKTKNQISSDLALGLQMTLFNLMKITPDPLEFGYDETSEAEYLASCYQDNKFYALCSYLIRKLQVLYLYKRLEEAKICALEVEKYLLYITGSLPRTDYNFYQSLLLCALYAQASPEEQTEYQQKIAANQQQMKVWAENCPDNFEHKYLLVAAELARI
ncbi:MAG: serine/threonine-protein kinase PknK, partial [Planktothrix sp.]